MTVITPSNYPHYLFSTSTSTSTSTSNSNPICISTPRLHVMCYLYIFQECTSSHDLQCDSTVLQQGGHVIEGSEDEETGEVVVVQHREAFVTPVLKVIER
jgi:hypothetical protein